MDKAYLLEPLCNAMHNLGFGPLDIAHGGEIDSPGSDSDDQKSSELLGAGVAKKSIVGADQGDFAIVTAASVM